MKFRTVLRLLIGVPLLLLMIVFVLSNEQPVRFGLFPTDYSLELPLSVAMLSALGLGFFLGGMRVWFAALRYRRTARQATATVRVMEAKQQELKTLPAGRLPAPPR